MTNKNLAYINAGDVLYRTAQFHRFLMNTLHARTLAQKSWFTPLWLTYASQLSELTPNGATHSELMDEIERQNHDSKGHSMNIGEIDLGHALQVAHGFRAWYKTMRKTQPRGWRERL